MNKEDCQNYIFQTDNLIGLKYLNNNNINIDFIYIDPPYNTKNKFIYKDKFSHEAWVEFMQERLAIAHSLLNQDGIIFISIDDNELYRLKLLMDEIFGGKNFISNFIWQNKYTVSNDKNGVSCVVEYILCYAKNKNLVKFSYLPLREFFILFL